MENRRLQRGGKGSRQGGAWGTWASSCSRSGLFASFLPSCTSGWFRISWKRRYRERGEALCVVCGRKRSSGKPPFPLQGKTMLWLATPPGDHSCPTLDVGSGCPSEGMERQRSGGFLEMAQLQWAENTRPHHRQTPAAAWLVPLDIAKGTAARCPESPGGCWGESKKRSLLPHPTPHPSWPCSAGLIPPTITLKMEPGAGQRWEWVSLSRAHPNSSLRPAWSGLQPHFWEAREWPLPAAREFGSPQDGAGPVPPDTGYNEGTSGIGLWPAPWGGVRLIKLD